MPPHTSTLLLLNLPLSILCGIDLLTFTTNPKFLGIKSIPPGWHFLYVSETADVSLREGFWFFIPGPSSTPPPLLLYAWDNARGGLRPCVSEEEHERYHSTAVTQQERLTPYRQSASSSEENERDNYWPHLTPHITSPLLARFTKSTTDDYTITTASCAAQDLDDIPGLGPNDPRDDEKELGVLGINLARTWREGAIGRERTEGRLDTSWALSYIVHSFPNEQGEGNEWGAVILGEMELCFLMVVTIANWSCLEEWKRCLGLVLGCKSAVRAHEAFFAAVLALLKRQLERGEDVEGGLFDMGDEGAGWLKGLLRSFKKILGEVFEEGQGVEVKEQMEELERWLRGEYGWELCGDFVRRGMLELEDGEVVEMDVGGLEDGEEERGEYAPVVVEM